MRVFWHYICLLLGTAGPLMGQGFTPPGHRFIAGFERAGEPTVFTTEDPQDAGQQLYRQGFTSILEERWREAREAFTKLTREFPGSAYIDDASYWSAYALRYTDRQKAIDEYRAFLKQFRRSPYLPDALADLAHLEMQKAASPPAPHTGSSTHDIGRFSYELQLGIIPEQMVHRVKLFTQDAAHVSRIIVSNGRAAWTEEHSLDQETRLRLQAVAALRASREDEKSFASLRTIAADPDEQRPVRVLALQTIAGSRRHDPLPVLVKVAKEDTSQDMQRLAINLIRIGARDKNRKIEALENLFSTLPPDRTIPLGTALFGIAEVGNDRAVDFLGRVAQTNNSYDLRSEAIFYLGNLDSEKARKTLYEFLEKQKE